MAGSENIKVKLPDGSVKEFLAGTTVIAAAEGISRRLAADAVAGKVDGQLVDLRHNLHHDCELELVTADSEDGLSVIRHTAAHVMAQAVKRLWPKVKLAIGPAIENGFYYDFDKEGSFAPEDLEAIEAEMHKIVAEDLEIVREEIPREEAIKRLKEMGEDYKVELVEDIEEPVVSFYRQGEFVDLCRGPHLWSTGKLPAFKLLNVAGAYWRGDEKRPMLARIYGTAFAKKRDLDQYLEVLEEAKRRDHRKLGKDLDLYSLHEEAGGGLVFYHPKGAVLRSVIEEFWRKEHAKRGYQYVIIPHIASADLWRQSGHYDYYRENMYFLTIEDKEYAIKPMNCPGHILIYKTETRSYRDMPVRYCELGTVYRYERSGVLHGLLRVRGFTQDDAHIFCRPDQLAGEIKGVIDLAFFMLRSLGFSEFEIALSTRPEKSVGSEEIWETAIAALREALESQGLKYTVDEGGGAFYGPKIDVHLKDALGRLWQGPTIQVDFNLPERFDVNYIGEDGEKHRVVMIHRTVLGSMERTIGVLVEHYAGAFPTWLSPVQVKILTISDKHVGYAREVRDYLQEMDVRVELDASDEKIGRKIREAQLEKVPYMLVIGDKEAEARRVAVRHRKDGDLGAMGLSEFRDKIVKEIKDRVV